MPRQTREPESTIFFGTGTALRHWEAEHRDIAIADIERANVPSHWRDFVIDSHTEVIDQLPTSWPHWSALIEWLNTQELSDSMMALLRRARLLNGVAIPTRNLGGENVQLDLSGEESAPASIHTLFFGSRQRYMEYARSVSRLDGVPRSAVIHVTSPQQLLGTTGITPHTLVENQLSEGDSNWYEYLIAMHQALVRSDLTREQAHDSYRRFLDAATRNSTVEIVFLGSPEAFDRWQRQQRVRESAYQRPCAIINISEPSQFRASGSACRVSRFTQVLDLLELDYLEWFDMMTLLRDIFHDVDTPDPSVTRAMDRCTQMMQRQVIIEARQMPVTATGGSGVGIVGQGGSGSGAQPAGAQRLAELERQLSILTAALTAIEEDTQREPAHRLAAAHARRVAEGQQVLWIATDSPQDYRLIQMNAAGNLIATWDFEEQRWVANSDEVWVRRIAPTTAQR